MNQMYLCGTDTWHFPLLINPDPVVVIHHADHFYFDDDVFSDPLCLSPLRSIFYTTIRNNDPKLKATGSIRLMVMFPTHQELLTALHTLLENHP